MFLFVILKCWHINDYKTACDKASNIILKLSIIHYYDFDYDGHNKRNIYSIFRPFKFYLKKNAAETAEISCITYDDNTVSHVMCKSWYKKLHPLQSPTFTQRTFCSVSGGTAKICCIMICWNCEWNSGQLITAQVINLFSNALEKERLFTRQESRKVVLQRTAYC